MLPKGWTIQKMRTLVSSVDAGVSVNGGDRAAKPNEFGVLKISAVTEGVFRPGENKVIRPDELQRAAVNPAADRILISRSNTEALVGASAYVAQNYNNLFLSDKLWQLHPDPVSKTHMPWLSHWLASDETRSLLSKLATGTSGSMKNISKHQLLSLNVPTPTLFEQRRIAKILATWDQAIAVTERLLVNSRKQKQSLMQLLLTGYRRFSEVKGNWKFIDFDSVFERIVRKNLIGNTNVLTISGEYGLISQRDYFHKSVASTNLTGYTLLERGDFAYNKSYSTGYPMGAIKPLLAYDAGVVSSLYLCFRLREGADASLDFFRHYFEAGVFNQELESIAQEGARNHGLLNVSVTDFFKLRLHIPNGPEQSQIAEIINVAEAEENHYKWHLKSLLIEKQALMQQMLTGKRRVHFSVAELEAQA